ncbi:MAG: LptA/OstA family protein [Pseudomonadota bacterium]
MNVRRLLLLATVSTAALAHQEARAELNPADIGGWGGAWGEEIVPEALPARRSTPTAPPAPAAAPVVRSTPVATGPSPADIGGWGDAWGEEILPAPAPARRASPVRPVATGASPAAAVPSPPLPSAADIGTWGDAWGGATAPAATPAHIAQSTATQPPESLPAEPSAGAVDPENPPVHLVADQIIHDRELGIVTATGNVEIVQTGKTLTADTVSYNLKQDVISASGNVTLVEPDGNVAFSEYFELTGDFKEGVAQEIRVLLADRSRMRASSARRVGGVRTDYDNPAYTACEPCAEDPDREPLWQVKAKEATHDQATRMIEYRDVWMELGGVPVAYTPYLSHPDPTVKRKSGFLIPTAGVSSSLGTNITVPYFWAIADNQDLTFSPRFLFPKSEVTRTPEAERVDREILRRMVLAGEHRWVGTQGETRTAASLTAHKRTGELRGHIKAKGRFDFSEV